MVLAPVVLTVVLTGITLLVRRLRKSEERFRLIAEHAHDLVGLHDPDGKHIWLSPSVERVLGFKAEEMIGRNAYEFFHEDDLKRVRDTTHAPVLEGQQQTTTTYRAQHKDGHYVWLETVTSPVFGPEGKVARLVTASRDVTERKKAQDLYRFLVRHLPDTSVFLFDRSFRHIIADGSLTGKTIPPATNLEGRTLYEVFPEDMAATLEPHYRRVFLGDPEVVEQAFRTRIYQITFLPIVYGSDMSRVSMGMAVFHDVTEQKRVVQALQDQAHDLERSNRDLERFANVASHELKSPLRRIASFAELLAEDYEGLLDASADEYIAEILDGASSLAEVIEALLQYSRVQTDATRMDWVDLNVVCGEAVQALSKNIKEARAVIRKGHLPTVAGDGVLLKQLITNLIGNSIKFYEGPHHPEITITAFRELLDWEIAISDNGPGVDPEQRRRIFEMFKRVRSDVEGSGIGLALCKKIVSIHRGTIWVDAQEGGGSRFCFRLPARAPEEVTDPSLPQSAMKDFTRRDTVRPPKRRR